jgi:Fe2+ transport system protein B
MQILNAQRESFVTLLPIDTEVNTIEIDISKILQENLASHYASVVFDDKEDNSIVLKTQDKYAKENLHQLYWNYSSTQERKRELVSLQMYIEKDLSIMLVAKSKQTDKEVAQLRTTLKELISE